MMSGVPLETYWDFKKLWNNKFYYKAATCWYFYWVTYDAQVHEYQCVILNTEPLLTTVDELGYGEMSVTRFSSLDWPIHDTAALTYDVKNTCI
jgi:hypothetical protein